MALKRASRARSTSSAEVTCPYWRARTALDICCEGFMDGSEITFRFENRADRLRYMRAFCESSYVRCPLCRAANDKYDVEDEV